MRTSTFTPHLFSNTFVAALLLGLPCTAVAATRAALLIPGTTSAALNLDTGDKTATGGDILWDGNTITAQGTAKFRNLGQFQLGFTTNDESYFVQQAAGASETSIPADQMKQGDVFVVVTNAGNVSKVLVGTILPFAGGASRVNLTYETFAGVSPNTPVVTRIENNSSNIPEGYPNYGIAPSSIFIVAGANLSGPGDPVLQSSVEPGIPLSLNGTSITVTVNGVTTHPALYYTSPTQLAAVLPASTPVGAGTLTVTHDGVTSQPATLTVVASALGFNQYDGNLGVATDALTYAILTYTAPGTPSEAITLWATGLGADSADSDTTYIAAPHTVSTPLQIYIGGIQANILYQGSSQYPGVNQINVVIPSGVPTGCWVPMTAIAGGIVSNSVFLPISSDGGVCHDPVSGVSGDQIPAGGPQTLRAGLLALVQTNNPADASLPGQTNSTDASFQKYSGIFPTPTNPTPGTCILNPPVAPIPQLTGLDAGTISLTGPNNLSIVLGPQQGIKGAFYSALGANDIPAAGGTYTFTGTGGADVGPFTSTLTLSNPLLTWTNQGAAAAIDRSQPFRVTWNGGNPGSVVYIYGGSYSVSLRVTIGFSCAAHTDDGQFTVPAYILNALPAGSGTMGVQNGVMVPLTASGLDTGSTGAGIAYSVDSTFQ